MAATATTRRRVPRRSRSAVRKRSSRGFEVDRAAVCRRHLFGPTAEPLQGARHLTPCPGVATGVGVETQHSEKKGLGLFEEPSVDAAPPRPMRRPGKIQLVPTVLEQAARIVKQHGAGMLEMRARKVRQVGPPREYPRLDGIAPPSLGQRAVPAGRRHRRSGPRRSSAVASTLATPGVCSGSPAPANASNTASASASEPRFAVQRHQARWPEPPTRGSSPRRPPDVAPPPRSGRWRAVRRCRAGPTRRRESDAPATSPGSRSGPRRNRTPAAVIRSPPWHGTSWESRSDGSSARRSSFRNSAMRRLRGLASGGSAPAAKCLRRIPGTGPG